MRDNGSVAGSSSSLAPTSTRVLSVDALRGFDMLWIIGAGSLVRALDKMNSNWLTQTLSTQLKHCQWAGFRFYDLIFPLFLFLIGASLVFSLDKTIAQEGRWGAFLRIARRSLLLFALGVFRSGGLTEPWPGIALAGVLQRIASCYFFAAMIYVCCSRNLKAMASISVVLLVGYWALLTFVPFPDIQLNRETVTALADQAGSDSPAAIASATTDWISGVYEEGHNLTNFGDLVNALTGLALAVLFCWFLYRKQIFLRV